MVKNLLAMWDTQVRSLSREDPLEKEMATHSSILAWRIPWTEEPGQLQSTESAKSLAWLTDEHWPLVKLTCLTWACHFLLSKHLYKPVNSTVLTFISVLELLKYLSYYKSQCFLFHCTQPNPLPMSILVSLGMTPPLYRSKPVLRPRLTVWGGSTVPLRKNIYNCHSHNVPPKGTFRGNTSTFWEFLGPDVIWDLETQQFLGWLQ